jgi:hypothetical protein
LTKKEEDKEAQQTNLILLGPKPLNIAPSNLIHSIRVAQIRSRLIIMLRSSWVFLNAPAMAKAVPQLEHGEDELAFGGSAFLHASFEGESLDFGAVGGGEGEVLDGLLLIGFAAPAVPAGGCE